MKRLWLRYAERIDALSLRERVMVFSAAMAVLLALVHGLYIDSEVQRERRLTGTLAQKQTESKTLQDQLAKLVTGRGADPDRLPRERLAVVRAELSDVEARIAAEERKFTAPEQMRKVIEELLARSRGVELRTLKNLPTTSIAEVRAQAAPQGGKPAAAPAERLIYRHGIEVTVTGSYLDLLGYIADLERMPTQLYWSSLEIDARNFPRHTMKLVVYTLSLNPTWLNV